MLASTRLGNVPINDKTLELMEDDIEEFERLRDRWGRLTPCGKHKSPKGDDRWPR